MLPAARIRLLIFAVGLVACGHSHHTPALHRAAADICATDRPAFLTTPPPSDAGMCTGYPDNSCVCTSDSQCETSPGLSNGRCGDVRTTSGFFCGASSSCNRCTYDRCFSDSDCPAIASGGVAICNCRETPNHGTDSVSHADPNLCEYGNNCRVDSDCASTGFPFCSPSTDSFCQTGTVGWFCHTSDDECSDDTDCEKSLAIDAVCAWEPSQKHWACAAPKACLDGGA